MVAIQNGQVVSSRCKLQHYAVGVWNTVEGVDCWSMCGEVGGLCDACTVDGSAPGYCCHNNLDSTNPNHNGLNGDCPSDAIAASFADIGVQSNRHTCIRKFYPGKNLSILRVLLTQES